jgi:predicted transcriptional regulator
MKKEPMYTTSLTIAPSLYRKVIELADRHCTSASAVFRRGVAELYDREMRQARRFNSPTAGHDETRGEW